MPIRSISLAAILLGPLFAQTPPPQETGPHPLYRITIVQRSTPAINYTHRSEPTPIDFKGTPLMPDAHGEATVENRRGATMIDAHFDHVAPPTRFGSQYLTYVVWAITPDGRAQSVGELVLNGSDKGHLQASTPFQAFALIVTAEPYFSVSQPSDVVVMENAIRPDTVGEVQSVNATYELLPRKEYTYNITAPSNSALTQKGLSMPEYEALVATYEAKNAIQIAAAAGAQRYAPERLHRAEVLFEQARQFPRKTLSEQVVSKMREIAQIAEDARAISVKRAAQERAAEQAARDAQEQAQAQKEAALAQQQRLAEQADAERARLQAQRDRQQAEQQRQQMEAQQQAMARQEAAQTADRLTVPPPDNARQMRAQLRRQLSGSGFQTLDTPRGVVVIVPDDAIETNSASVRNGLASVASTIAAYPGLRVEVDGNSEGASSENANYAVSESLANHVRDLLAIDGVAAGAITTRAFGSTHPMAPNGSPQGRQQNRRVEIVISGDVIGNMPVWDRPYPLDRRPAPR